ncbi:MULTISPECIES: hypothetical protein [Cyanobacterium]|uniref:hypothetical protein n=1 Tax=Cyanobacterium TaxID=102234 RepID=UPI000C12A8C4|nr:MULTISPECIES: hypothetical protein [Cyanobacterium]PHV63757.1 hypothetical protein CSQ80_04085 [Cyanobacterium aponinum IPPAS B-1201]WVL00421.1 hypothetical protein Dongsha4_17515 [Cyanobacterium sp. Dongsha4]
MKISERSAQIWSILALSAHNRQMLTYKMVYQLTGMAISGLGKCLEPIQSYCLLNNLPPLTILVVNQNTGLPGVGFIATDNIPKTLLDVFSYDWLNHGSPTPEQLEEAVKQLPSNNNPDAKDSL